MVPNEHLKEWQQWLLDLPRLERFSVIAVLNLLGLERLALVNSGYLSSLGQRITSDSLYLFNVQVKDRLLKEDY